MGNLQLNHKVKDSLFCELFSEKSNALSLYNAIHGTEYTDESEVEIVTLKSAVFIGDKNDVSICFDSKITLWEHQSTINFNMPLRGLIYYSGVINGYLEKKGLKKKIYRKALVKIPAPDYYVLYNGAEDVVERDELYLSDAFMTPSPGYEWTAKLININAGKNKKLMDACDTLKGYSMLIAYLRENINLGMGDEDAVDAAIDRCIKEGYLKDYLIGKRGEAKYMLLNFDENDLEESLKEEREEGRQEGQSILAEAIKRLKNGETSKELINSGLDEYTVNLAMSCQ